MYRTSKIISDKFFPGPKTFFGVVAFVPVIPSRNKQLPSSRRSSTALSIQATKTIFTGTRTQYIFSAFDPFKISSWFQGISIPSLGQIGGSLLKL
jgi:hypothetical protein